METTKVSTVGFTAESIDTQCKLDQDALSSLIRLKSLFSLPKNDLLSKSFKIVRRHRESGNSVALNDIELNNIDHDPELRNRIRFEYKSENGTLVLLSVRQILSLPTKDTAKVKRVIADEIRDGELDGLPTVLKFAKVEYRTEKINGKDEFIYPYHFYKSFREKVQTLRELHSKSENRDEPFDFGQIYQNFDFLATLHGTEIIPTATESDIVKNVVVKAD